MKRLHACLIRGSAPPDGKLDRAQGAETTIVQAFWTDVADVLERELAAAMKRTYRVRASRLPGGGPIG